MNWMIENYDQNYYHQVKKEGTYIKLRSKIENSHQLSILTLILVYKEIKEDGEGMESL